MAKNNDGRINGSLCTENEMVGESRQFIGYFVCRKIFKYL